MVERLEDYCCPCYTTLMIVTPYKTKAVTQGDILEELLTASLPTILENSIVVVTSKIVSICEGSIIKCDEATDKQTLIYNEAEFYIDAPDASRYDVTLTIKGGSLVASAGIDESNGNGSYILWPKDPAQSAASIWQFLKDYYHLTKLGVIISDSRTVPLRWGTIGMGIAWCGFNPLKNYIGEPDIFGRNLKMTKASMLDGLAAAAVIVMGEGNEQTPLAVISDIPGVEFTERTPTNEEIRALRIDPKDDIYAPIINSPLWHKGGK